MLTEKQLKEIANILRRDSLKATTAAGSGHPSSCLSCAEIMSCLFFSEMSYDVKNPSNLDNDEFILSKGHAAPILYSALFRAGCIKEDLESLRKLNSKLEGHPVPSLKWIKVATGSLGQGLSIALGMALAAKIQGRKYRTFVLLGDSEIAEGSNYEAAQLASFYKLGVIAILDANKLGQRGETMIGHNLNEYELRFKALGWNTTIIDGHDIAKILEAIRNSKQDQPNLIIARTYKGKGVLQMQNKLGWHGKALTEIELRSALSDLPAPKMPKPLIKKPEKIKTEIESSKLLLLSYQIGENIATREAYGKALASIASSNSSVLVLDAEVSDSTKSEEVKKQTPRQFIECFIAEQNMIGMALGLSKKGFNVFASTFSAFLSRAHDQLRMASLSQANFTICGSHSGVSVGKDGASQMGLEDIALFRSLPNSIIFYPSDANSTAKLVELASKTNGLKYIRTTRPKTPVIYNEKEKFAVGDFKVLKQSNKDKAILVGSGITVHECLKAHEFLKTKKIDTSVIDLYCIKPFNSKKFIEFVKKHGKKIILAEDHYKAGGIGEMISSEIANTDIKFKHLCINEIPHSGTTEELLAKYRINWEAIVEAVKSI